MSNDFIINDGELLQYTGNEEKVIIPDGVTGINSGTFTTSNNSMAITEIVIPDSVRYIGQQAFAQLGLRKIKLPEGLKRIERQTFFHCYNLDDIVIPESVTEIGRGAFVQCGLERIKLPDNITRIESGAFGWCCLQEVNLPENLSYIGTGAFDNCSDLAGTTGITVPGTVKKIPAFAFQETIFEYIHLSEGTEIIEAAAFRYAFVDELALPSTLRYIGDEAFYKCIADNIEELVIPDSVAEIGNGAFGRCGMKRVVLPQGLKTIPDSAFINCCDLEEVIIPDSVQSIEDYAFAGCVNLESVKIPDSVKYISKTAFKGCNKLKI